MATLVDQLDPPAPFTMNGLRSRLEQHCHRTVRMISTTMPPDTPPGVWVRTDRADWLFYEDQTSPFHQAHIVSSLAAHILLGDKAGGTITERLVPNVDVQPGRMILGAQIGEAVSHAEAEAFAFEVLRRSGLFPGYLQAQRLLRCLRPLRSALLTAVPSVAQTSNGPGPLLGATPRLYYAVIEIRDAALALKPDGASGMAVTAPTPEPLKEPAAPSLNAAAQAASLIHKRDIDAASSRQAKRAQASSPAPSPADLRLEGERLVEVSEILARSARKPYLRWFIGARCCAGADHYAAAKVGCAAPIRLSSASVSGLCAHRGGE